MKTKLLIIAFAIIFPSMFVGNAYGSIFLDKDVYTWTDKINIRITEHGIDSDKSSVKISTDNHELSNYKLSKAGNGLYTGEIILTGFLHDVTGDGKPDTTPRTVGNGPNNGFLESGRDEIFTITVEFGDGDIISKSAKISWNEGNIVLDKSNYLPSESAKIQVTDADMNLNPETLDKTTIHVFSESDKAGIIVDAIETEEESGLFETTFSFTQEQASSGNRLFAVIGDGIYAQYDDYTLPVPFRITDNLEIIAESTLFVDSPIPEPEQDKTVVDSAHINWIVGQVEWLEESYPATGTSVVRVIDPDMNLDPKAVDNFDVDVWSDSDVAGIDLTVTETNDATGIFEGTVFFSTNDESSGHRLRVAEGETITVKYEDHTLPDSYTHVGELDVISTALIQGIYNPENVDNRITLDKKTYTWTDKVLITITSPEHNLDNNSIEEIGNSDQYPIKIATRHFDLDNYKLVETGVDTGIFVGEVILAGFTHDADGNAITGINGNDVVNVTPSGQGPTDGLLPSDDEDGITVSFEFAEDETAIRSAPITWNTGQIEWLETRYLSTGTGVVRVIDPDMNLNPEEFDNFDVDVWSDSDAGGIDLTLTETNVATGIFEGTVFFSTDNESSGHRLQVSDGDTITAEYEDNTLPEPSNIADQLDIIGTAMIQKIPPPKQQLKNNIEPTDISCNTDLVLIFKASDNSPACVKPSTVQKLVERGWANR